MSLSKRLHKAWNGLLLKEEPLPHAANIAPEPDKTVQRELPTMDFTGWKGIPRRTYSGGDLVNVMQLRRLSLSPTPYMCIQRLTNDVVTTQWEIKALAKENSTEPDQTAKEHARTVQNWFEKKVNDTPEPFGHLLSKVTNDILTIDAAAFLKEYASGSTRYMTQLWAVDGGFFTKEVDEFRRLGKIYDDITVGTKTYKHYSVGYWYNRTGQPTPFEPHEIVYMLTNPRSDIDYGTSRMQIVKTIVGSLMYGEEYYHEFWRKGGVGSCIIGTEGEMTDPVWETWRKRLKESMESTYIKQIPMDRKPTISALGPSPKDLQWLETKDEYRHLVMAIFNTTPEVHGFTQDIHRSTAESQRGIYIKKGLWPLLKSLEWYINTQVITEWFLEEDRERGVFSHGHAGKWHGQDVDIMFRFKLYDPLGDKQELDIDKEKLASGLQTINEWRKKQGLPPVAWGDLNPLFLLNPQQWAQSFYFRALTPEGFANLTGAPTPKEALTAVTPQTTSQQDVTAYKLSRIEETNRR